MTYLFFLSRSDVLSHEAFALDLFYESAESLELPHCGGICWGERENVMFDPIFRLSLNPSLYEAFDAGYAPHVWLSCEHPLDEIQASQVLH